APSCYSRCSTGSTAEGGGMTYFMQLLISGAMTGLMYSMVALGIVLIYKSSSVVNFAQGAMVMTAGYVFWALSSAGLPMVVAIVLSLVAMFLFGLLAERLLLRRMVGQPIIMIVMLTLGLDIFLLGLVPGVVGAGAKTLN